MGRGKRNAVTRRSLALASGNAAATSAATTRPSDEVIREAWERSEHRPAQTAHLLQRPKPSVRRWLIELGLHASQPQEVKVTREQVLETVARLGSNKLAAAALGVSAQVISYHLGKAEANLVDGRPTASELAEAWQRSGGSPDRTAALLGGRSPGATRRWLAEAGLFAPRDYKRWSDEDDELVRKHYARSRASEGGLAALADRLSTTVPALLNRAASLDLTDRHATRPYQQTHKALSNEEVDAMLTDLADYDGTSAQWQRERSYTNKLIDELRERRPYDYKKAKEAARKRHGASSAQIGRGFEIKVQRQMERSFRQHGLKHFIVRGHDLSYGAGDIGIYGYGKSYEIQSETHGSFSPEKWNRLYAWCRMQNVVPLVVRQGPDGPEFFRVMAKKTGVRGERQPMVPFDWDKEITSVKKRAARLEAEFDN